MRRMGLSLALAFLAVATARGDGPMRPVLGAPDFNRPTVAALPEHARAWLTSSGWTAAGSYRFELATGGAPVTRLVAVLWCSSTSSVVGPYREVARPRRNASLALEVRPDTKAPSAPCRAAVGWDAAGVRVSWVWDVAERPAAKAKVAMASPSWAVTPASINSLPYRVECDPISGCLPNAPMGGAGLFVCFLAGQVPPTNRLYQVVNCPGETRSSVTSVEWCNTLRNIGAGFGVPPERAELIRRQACP